MKIKDIEVGKEYADAYGYKLFILEVGVYGTVFHGRMVSGSRSSHKHYVRVRTRTGFKDTRHFRSIVRTWEAQEKIDKADGVVRDGERAEIFRLWNILERYVPGIERDAYKDTDILLYQKNITKICEALERLGEDRT